MGVSISANVQWLGVMRKNSKMRPRAGAIALDADAGTAEAFRTVAHALLLQIASQADPVCALDPDGVHQMRIGLRRLRAAISLFADLVAGEQTERVKAELRWLTGRLGPARDFHVMKAALRRRRRAGDDPKRDAQVLARVSARRAAAFEGARRAVSSPRYRALLLTLLQWIDAGDWTGPDALSRKQRNARRFAEIVLTRRAGKVAKRAEQIGDLTAECRHRLRIAMKKLYYAVGFFESLFPEDKERKRLASFRKRLKRLLDDLGALNDIAVQRRLLARLTPRAAGAAAAKPTPRDRARIEKLLQSSIKDGRRLARCHPFRH